MVANESRLRSELQSSNQKLSRELQLALEGMLVSANAQKEKYYLAKKKKCERNGCLPHIFLESTRLIDSFPLSF